jgi:5'-deoxynucleotidase YfbR-like HD superfamily hydrolase
MKKHVPTWFQTFTGVKFNPNEATAEDIRIQDIAHALSHYCRFGGHTIQFYSVAQHLCMCHDNVKTRSAVVRFQALLHDASEAYLGDVVKPLKVLLKDYQKIEKRLEAVIAAKFGLPAELLPQVKEVDLVALATEKRDLLVSGPEWELVRGIEPWKFRITPWPSTVAEAEFMRRFTYYYGVVNHLHISQHD